MASGAIEKQNIKLAQINKNIVKFKGFVFQLEYWFEIYLLVSLSKLKEVLHPYCFKQFVVFILNTNTFLT